MKVALGCLAVVVAVCVSGCGPAKNPQAETAAIAAAEKWLALVDKEAYATSWDEAAALFKGAIEKEQWVQILGASRKSFGENLSREVKSSRHRTSLPGAPDGEYVIIQFKASFENKQSGIETVTPMLDQDGQWRVSGYYMK